MLLIACLVIAASAPAARAVTNSSAHRDVIGFPEVEENSKLANKDNRQPVYLPAMCPVNELYYPGDQKDDWICDCRPAFIYQPASDTCWPAYQRGPCQNGQYLVLHTNSVIPACEKNPCIVDGYVPWNGKCERLGSVKPCDYLFPTSAALGVNDTTMVVSCVKLNLSLNLENRFGDTVMPEYSKNEDCPPGCRRSITGKCVPISY